MKDIRKFYVFVTKLIEAINSVLHYLSNSLISHIKYQCNAWLWFSMGQNVHSRSKNFF